MQNYLEEEKEIKDNLENQGTDMKEKYELFEKILKEVTGRIAKGKNKKKKLKEEESDSSKKKKKTKKWRDKECKEAMTQRQVAFNS